jgi:hypothetical protein
MRNPILILFFIYLASCTSPLKTTYHYTELSKSQINRDGLSYETAIIIYEETESGGITTEHIWLNNHYPNYKFKMQLLSTVKKHTYDIFEIITQEGKEITVYFDICNFLGKH